MFATFSDSGSLMHETVAATPDDEVYAFGFVCQEFDVVITENGAQAPERAIICTKLTDNMEVFKDVFGKAYDVLRHDRHASLNGDVAADPIDND